MAKPQIENGHTKIANELAVALARSNLSAYESRVLWCVLVKTYGWNKKFDRISYSQFEKVTQIKRRHLGRTIKTLIKRRMLICSGEGQQLEYSIQKDYDLWQESHQQDRKPLPNEVMKPLPNEVTPCLLVSTITPIGDSNSPNNHYLIRAEPLPNQGTPLPNEVMKPLPNEVNTKAIKHITKAIDKSIYEIPEWVEKEVWAGYLEMRTKIKQPPTDYAVKLVFNALERFRAGGQDPNEILNQSIMNNWRGVFALKNNGGKNGAQNGTTGAYRGNPSQKPAGAFQGLE